MNKLIIISGPTASGKTKISIELADKIMSLTNKSCVIVNFDSLLFYKEISIGTAKPNISERKGIPHYMIDIESIKSPMNAADFIKIGEKLIKDLMEKDQYVILVGGSAFYLRALLKGMYESVTPSVEVKEKIDQIFREQGISAIIDYLKLNDPESLQNLHPNDQYRLTRAAIHFEMTKTKISDLKINHDSNLPYDFSQIIHPWNILHIYLDLPREQHFEIIKNRTEKMFKDGLLIEIERLVASGFTLNEKPLGSIGYKEAIMLKNGHFQNATECMERIAISTRQLAKSQRTFFNKITPKMTFNPLTDQEKIFRCVEQFLT